MLQRFLYSLLILCFSQLVLAQQTNPTQYNPPPTEPMEKCKTDIREASLMQNAEYAAKRQAAESITEAILDQKNNSVSRDDDDIYTIPVVFHVIHKGEAVGSGTNISDAQLHSAIDALNRDFTASSADDGIAQSDEAAAAGNTLIEFCLASTDPDGDPTSGINRVSGNSVFQYSSQGITDNNELEVKNLSRWDNRYYLNVWVVSEIDNNNGDIANPNFWTGGVLAYAYFPTNPVTFNAALDGVVITNLCIGNDPDGAEDFRLAPFTLLNRTLTHEVGHSLNLYHTFQGGSCSQSNCNTQGDKVCDTPPTTLNYDCDSPACSGNQQVENYLDYTDDDCMELFSNGQRDRMRAALEGVRSALIITDNCTPSINYDVFLEIATSTNEICSADNLEPQVSLTNNGQTTLTSLSFNYQLEGESASIYNWTGTLLPGASTLVDLPAIMAMAGENDFSISLIQNSLNGTNADQNIENNSDSWTFAVDCGSTTKIAITLDNAGSQTTWLLFNSDNEIVSGGGPYQNNQNGILIEEINCLPQDCYTFTIYDAGGNGICCGNGNGSFTVENLSNSQILAEGGSFSSSVSSYFCISNNQEEIISETACGSYVFNEETFTETGVYLIPSLPVNGCENGSVLNLTINPEYNFTITVSACESYNYGILEYNNSGTYQIPYTSLAGCDSTITLELTINEPSDADLSISTCDSYTAADGIVYTETGNYEAIIVNEAGCDSIISISLTITGYTDACGVCIENGESNPLWNASCADCESVPNGINLPGSPCDDENAATENDVYNSNCVCEGSIITAEIEGSVVWNTSCGERAASLKLYEPGTINLLSSQDILIDANGNFNLENIEPGIYDIFIKVEGYLQKGFAEITLQSGANNLAIGEIIAGDFDNNNGINIVDVTLIIGAFSTVEGDVNFISIADINCDGGINILDFTLATSFYGNIGDVAPLD